jgi:peptidoglycan/xylan/chitin deacetylase (PgdA/CDA1 family)
VLEVQEDDFTRRFGGPKVASRGIVDVDDTNPRATVVADLRAAGGVADGSFDAIILTQTLHVIDDMAAVLGECRRVLAPGGVLLATLPAASRVCLEYGEDGDLWRVTPAGARALFDEAFGARQVEVTSFGSVLTNVAFLHGLSCGELTEEEFAASDPYHPLLAGVRARKTAPVSRGRVGEAAVLLYHRVDDEADVHDLSVPPTLLARQLEWLSRECRVVPLEALLSGARDGHPERTVAITFDDGYLDALDEAAPVLERLGLPAAMFVTTRWLEDAGEYWWDALERVLLGGPTPPELTIALGETISVPTRTPGERRAAHDQIHSRLVHASLPDRDRVVAALQAWSGRRPDSRRRPLRAEELRRLARVPGISIGAHSVNHLSLPDQPPGVQRAEVLESVRTLERVLDTRITTFAFPYGAIDRASADVTREICSWSMATDARPLPRSFDAARVPRLEVKRWETPVMMDRLTRLFAGEAST